MSFEPAKAKLIIGSLDEDITVTAQYNPKEVQIDRAVPWKKPDAANKTGADADAAKKADEKARSKGAFGAKKDDNYMTLEFTGGEGRTMTVEMLFDEYEGSGRTVDVVAQIAALDTMAKVQDPSSELESKRRPHHCIVTWGARGMPNFKCVIEQLSTKYTMFSTDGKPLRATCTVKLKEANALERKAST
jgi:hypothetical protein